MGGQLLIGAVIGGVIGFLFGIRGPKAAVMQAVLYARDGLARSFIPVMLCLTVLMLVFNLTCYLKLRKLVLECAECEDDEVCDRLEDRTDLVSTISLTGNGIFYILIFFNFGVRCILFDNSGVWELVVFVAAILMYPLFYILTINVLKKHDPSKRGNPGKMSFQKDWLESCDEAEKMKIYKVGYQSHIVSAHILVIGFCSTLICSMIFDLGTFPAFATAVMWLVNTVMNGYYSIRSRREKIDIGPQ